jgi:cellulose synthase/poly-beta-1,6-N-acetylglucosamine synthase-like glycosyltransferase
MHYLIREYDTNSSKLFTKPFFIIPAKNQQNVEEKIIELENMQAPYIIICGERINHPNVVYRKARGKWDAINFGSQFIPKDANVIVLNDVDTKIHNFKHALSHLSGEADIVYCRVNVLKGPQVKFYRIADPIRKRFHIFASGELMLIKRKVFKRVLPIPPCIAEDSYILFKALELGYCAHFCTKTYVTTDRTANAKEEEAYKARTTLGVYQVLKHTRPPPWIRTFYALLPIAAPLLALAGEDGKAWMRGIRRAISMILTGHSPTKF